MQSVLLRRPHQASTDLATSGVAARMRLYWAVSPTFPAPSFCRTKMGEVPGGFGVVATGGFLKFGTGTFDRINVGVNSARHDDGEVTLLARFIATSSVTAIQQLISEDGTGRVFQFRINAGSVEFIPFSGGTPDTSMAVPGLQVGQLYTAIASYRPGHQYVRVYRENGGLLGADTSTVAGKLSYASSVKARVGIQANDTTNPFVGLMQIAAGGGRYIGADDADRLAINPWQLLEPRRILVPVSVAGGAPGAELDAAQTVGAFTQTASVSPVAGLSATQQVGSFGQTATVTTENAASLSATQTVGAFTQTATVSPVAGLSATQQVGAFDQTATLGPIASASATQTVGAFTQTATVTTQDGVNATATQQVGAFTQIATAKADASASAAQTVGAFTQTASVTTQNAASLSATQQVGAFTQTASVDHVSGLSATQQVGNFGQSAQVSAEVAAQVAQQVGAFLQTVLVTVRDAGSAELPASVVFYLPPDGIDFALPPDGATFALPPDGTGMELAE